MLLLIIFVSATSVKGQVTGYRLEWNGNSVTFSTVSGLDLPARITLSGVRQVQTSGVKSMTLYKLRLNADNEIYRWFTTAGQGAVQKRDVVIRLLNQNGEPLKAWKIRQAGPVKVELPTLSAKGNEVAIETVVLTHEGIEPE